MAKKPKDGAGDGVQSDGDQVARATRLTVVAKAPLWRGPPGWDMYWPAGETLVEGDELASRDPDLVEAMIVRLGEDPHFSVQVEREKVEG